MKTFINVGDTIINMDKVVSVLFNFNTETLSYEISINYSNGQASLLFKINEDDLKLHVLKFNEITLFTIQLMNIFYYGDIYFENSCFTSTEIIKDNLNTGRLFLEFVDFMENIKNINK